ncbi:MAG: hypothetical protein WD042_18110 [Phycisphaeraceae bacterium]
MNHLTKVALLMLVLGVALPAGACPMCAGNLPSDDGGGATVSDSTLSGGGGGASGSGGGATNPMGADLGDRPQLAEGFYYSILVMLGVVISVPVGLGGMFYYAVKNKAPAGLNQTQK